MLCARLCRPDILFRWCRRSQLQRKIRVDGVEDVEEKQDLPVREGIIAYFEMIQDLLQVSVLIDLKAS